MPSRPAAASCHLAATSSQGLTESGQRRAPLRRSVSTRGAQAASVLSCLALPLLLVAAAPATAQMFQDPALDALYAAQRHEALAQAGRLRLAAQPGDAQGALALALVALRQGDAAPRQAALSAAEACLASTPQAAPCLYALGTVAGVQAASEGMLKMIGVAGRVRNSLQAAFAAEPAWFPARAALFQFYMVAPGVAGGSAAKARELARETPQVAQRTVLEALLAVADKQHEAALTQLAAAGLPGGPSAGVVMPAAGVDTAVQREALSAWQAAVFGLINGGQAERARPWAERAVRERPADAVPAFALARVHAEGGAHAQALQLYAQAAQREGAAELPIEYRRGLSLQALGRNDEARAALRTFFDAGRGSRANRDDARQRLEALGG